MHVTGVTPLLNVADVARSLAFYCDVLGFAVEDRWEPDGRVRWARVASGAAILMLNEHAGSDDRGARPGFSDTVLYLRVEDADAAHARLTAQGHAASAVETQLYGLREFHLRDPDGYELAITSPAAPDGGSGGA